jgi:VanZ family protein
MINHKLNWAILIAYCLFIYYLSSQPILPAPEWFPQQDKAHHGGAYAIMGILAWLAFKEISAKPLYRAILSIVFCSLYGMSDEWHQSFVVGRDSDWLDWLADTLGATAAVSGLWINHRYTKINEKWLQKNNH